MIDKVALANFLSETMFVFAYDIAGVVIALGVILSLILFFNRIFNRGSFLNG